MLGYDCCGTPLSEGDKALIVRVDPPEYQVLVGKTVQMSGITREDTFFGTVVLGVLKEGSLTGFMVTGASTYFMKITGGDELEEVNSRSLIEADA